MTMLWLWLYNWSTPLSWMLIAIAAVSAVVAVTATITRLHSHVASIENSDSRGRQLGAAQSTFLFAILWSVIYAIPEPNYAVRTITLQPKVIRTITQTRYVPSPSNYIETIKVCMDGVPSNTGRREIYMAQCRETANAATGHPTPVIRTITKTQTVFSKQVVHVPPAYPTLFDECIGATNNEYVDKLDLRKTCHIQAMQAASAAH